MENKYYTPKIEDFHVGFKYEIEDLHDNLVDSTFRPITADWQELNMVYDDWEHDNSNFHKNYRVKYLDKQDIESLGWILVSEYGAGKEYRFGDCYSLTTHNHSGLTYGLHDITINKLGIFDSKSPIYIGNCPSINEFKYIQKLLGIK